MFPGLTTASDQLQASAPDVSAVVISYNRRARLPAVIEPLLTDPALLEIIVVLDGSTDGSEQWLTDRAQSEPRLRWVATENQGQIRARQTGADAARGSYVLFLDDDVLPCARLVSGHRTRHGEREDLVVVGYMPIAVDERIPDSWVVRAYRGSYEECCEQWRGDPAAVLDRLWAGNFSIAKSGLTAMGGVDCGVRFEYHGDQLTGWRARAAGLSGVFDPELVAQHCYERDMSGYVRDCYHQGYDRALLALMCLERPPEAIRGLGGQLVGPAPVVRRAYAVLAASLVRRPLAWTLAHVISWMDRLDAPRARDRMRGELYNLERAAGAVEAVRRVRAGEVTLGRWDTGVDRSWASTASIQHQASHDQT
jgi:glycosyltransferase involved in cell wall biosynthesis